MRVWDSNFWVPLKKKKSLNPCQELKSEVDEVTSCLNERGSSLGGVNERRGESWSPAWCM